MADGKIIIETGIDNKGLETGLKGLGSIAKIGLKGATIAVGAAVTAIGGLSIASIKVGMDFEAGMSKVQAISGATGEELTALTEKAKEMGAKTKFSAGESAEAFQYMAMAGWKTNDMLNGIDGIMNLAAASGEELALVSDIVTDALTAFGMSAKDSAEFADLLASAASNSNTNVSMLGESFKYVAPVAGALSMSAKDTAFALGLMANAGIKGSQSGTALRASLTNLAKPTDKMAAEMDKLGISLVDANGNVKDGKVLYDELREKFSGLTDAQKTQSAATIFGKEAMSGMLAIINASEGDYNKLYESLNNSAGAAENMAKTMQNNLSGSIEQLGGGLETLGLTVYEKFKEPLKNAIDSAITAVDSLVDSFSNGGLSESIDRIAEGFGNLIATLSELIANSLPKLIEGLAWILDNGPGIAIIIGTIAASVVAFKAAAVITTVVQSWQKAKVALALYKTTGNRETISQGVMNGVFTIWETIVALITGKITFAAFATGLWTKAVAALNAMWAANPIGIVIVAIVAVIGVLVYFWKTNEGFRNAVTKAWNAILDAGKAVWGWLVNFFTKDIPNAWNSMIAWFGSVGDWFVELWGKIKQGFFDGWNSIASFFTESIPAWWEGVKQSFVDGLQAIGNFFTETIPALIQKVGEWFNELPYKIGYALGFALTTIIQWGVDTWNNFILVCSNVYYIVTEWFSKLPGRIWEFLVNAYNKTIQWGTNTWNKFIETCTNIYNSVTEWFRKLPGAIWSWLVNAYNNVVNWGTQTYNNMVNTVSNAVNAVIEWFAKLPGRIWEWLLNTIKKVIQFGKDLGAKSREAGGEMVKNIIGAVKDLPSKFLEIGINIVKGIWDGIKSMGGWIGEKVTGFFKGMFDGAKKANDIHSPSRLYRDKIGAMMAQGVGVGFEDEAENVQKSIEKDFKRMAGKMQLAVDYNMASTTASIVGRNGYRGQSNVINNNDNGITQNVTIVNPERTPSENARALKKVGRDLAFGD